MDDDDDEEAEEKYDAEDREAEKKYDLGEGGGRGGVGGYEGKKINNNCKLCMYIVKRLSFVFLNATFVLIHNS